MSSARWLLEDARICLLGASGDRVFPDAAQMFAAVFGAAADVGGMKPDRHPADALAGITFSRYPAGPAIRIHGLPPGPVHLEQGVTADGRFVSLPEGSDQVITAGRWFPVDLEAMAEAQEWLARGGIARNRPITLGELLWLRASTDPPLAVHDETVITPGDLAVRAGQQCLPVPGLQATLYPYQRDGVAFLGFVATQGIGCILADEMGLGKTLQAIALLQSEKNAGRGPSLVVAPATLLENWRREIRQFAPDLRVLVHAGAGRAGVSGSLGAHDVVLVSFDTAVRDEPLLGGVPWDLLVLDEAQNIRNPEALRTLAVKRLPRRVSLAVTGTPVENQLGDLWSLADFVLPGLLGSLATFRSRFGDDLDSAGRLGRLVAPLVLRRRVTEVAADLPPKIEIPQPVRMDRALAGMYETVRRETLEEYGPAAGIVATTRLRMFCTHPALSMSWAADPASDMPKYQRLVEILGEIFEAGEKALVFTTYQAMSDLLLADLPRRWPQGFFRHIDGRVPVPDRQPVVDALYGHCGHGALVLNPKAAGTGLNITAANHVIHYNPEWNPAVTDQASRRAYRLKQHRPVTVHHLFFADTIEEVMLERAGFKRRLAGEAVTGHRGEADPALIVRALQISPLAGSAGEEP